MFNRTKTERNSEEVTIEYLRGLETRELKELYDAVELYRTADKAMARARRRRKDADIDMLAKDLEEA